MVVERHSCALGPGVVRGPVAGPDIAPHNSKTLLEGVGASRETKTCEDHETVFANLRPKTTGRIV
jgi:hypothetical protein